MVVTNQTQHPYNLNKRRLSRNGRRGVAEQETEEGALRKYSGLGLGWNLFVFELTRLFALDMTCTAISLKQSTSVCKSLKLL
jgi:hypothetical protein